MAAKGPNELLKYKPLRTIANDDYSCDKICRNTLTKDHVLIRRINKKYIVNNGMANSLDLQVKIMSKCEDRWWLRPIEYFQNNLYAYEVHECDQNAVGLHELIETELIEEQIRFLSAQLLACIESLHSIGYYSGSLTPRSFILCGDGIIRFSSVMSIKKIETSRPKERRKTVFSQERHLYLAPEMVDQMADEGPVADFWTLAVIMYQLYHDRQPFSVTDLDSPNRLIMSIELSDDSVPKDAYELLRSLLRKHHDRLGRHCVSEVKKHPYFNKTDWNFSNAIEILSQLLTVRHNDQNQIIWRELYVYDIPTSSMRDNIYFQNFKPLPDKIDEAAHLRQTSTYINVKHVMEGLLSWQPENPTLKTLWQQSICNIR